MAVVDYGIGNVLSVTRALTHCGASVELTDSPSKIMENTHLVLPGVGAFADGMNGLKERGLVDTVRKFVSLGRPFLGICLGMQIMFDMSEEFGEHAGLGFIPGRVVPIPQTDAEGKPHKIPHIGWNELQPASKSDGWENSILRGILPSSSVYFVHSFTAVPADDCHRLSDSFYNGRRISAVIRRGNLYGCQFHPEKSGPVGLKILQNFCAL